MMFRKLLRFLKDRRGNIAPMFALSLIPAVGMIGAAVDYTRANNIRSAMQSALDSTTLAMAGNASTLSADDMTAKATAYFNALFTKTGTTGVTLSINYTTTNGPQLVMTATTSVKTDFMNLPGFGISYIPVAASSTTAWGNSRLRVALALDNTGSMAQSSKMTTLKTAAKNLIDQLSAASTNRRRRLRVDRSVHQGRQCRDGQRQRIMGALVGRQPQHRFVGRPTTDRAAYRDPTTGVPAIEQGTCSVSGNNSQTPARQQEPAPSQTEHSQNTCTSHGVCSNNNYTSQNQCSSNGATWTWGVWTPATWTAAIWTPTTDHSAWNGCVMDRDQNHDIDNAAPSAGDVSTLFPAEQFNACPVEMMPLSYNWASLKTKIDSMVANGNTNTTIGLEWAWHSLTQGAPLSAPAEDAHYVYKKVIIFLTDGDNTQNRFSSSQSAIDARMTSACTNAKNRGTSKSIRFSCCKGPRRCCKTAPATAPTQRITTTT